MNRAKCPVERAIRKIRSNRLATTTRRGVLAKCSMTCSSLI